MPQPMLDAEASPIPMKACHSHTSSPFKGSSRGLTLVRREAKVSQRIKRSGPSLSRSSNISRRRLRDAAKTSRVADRGCHSPETA
jgi:hypothetical protein